MTPFDLKVPFLYAPKRADVYLTEALEGRYSREEIKTSLEKGAILLNGKPAKPRSLVREGDSLRGEIQARKEWGVCAEEIPLSVVYEDESLLVVDKPVGMVVHPGAGNRRGTLVNALLGRKTGLSSEGGAERPGIVHRLDKDTSGLLVVAKDNFTHRKLQAQFQARTLLKIYTAVVKGKVEYQEGHISKPIGRHPKHRLRMSVAAEGHGKGAETFYRVLRRFRAATLLEVRIATGRTHQIRVHMAHMGHPVLGDTLYGTKGEAPRLALHASRIQFEHPKTGKVLSLESPLPPDFLEILKQAESC